MTSEGANLPRLNWLTFRPKPTIYLCWLGSNPGRFTEIRRKFAQQRAKQQPELGLSEGREVQFCGKALGRVAQSTEGVVVPRAGQCGTSVP